MKKINRAWRFLKFHHILLRHGVTDLLFTHPRFKPWRFLNILNPYFYIPKRGSPATRLTHALIQAGPLFVKFGQVLSTRTDLLPPVFAEALSHLQDNVPPFPTKKAILCIETTFKQPITSLFNNFSETALASASIAQVHAATLLSGEKVIVKILRPHIKKKCRHDIDLIKSMVALFEIIWPQDPGLRLQSIIEEFETGLHDELDLIHEAANASQLRRNFKDSQDLYIPKIYWPYCRSNILVTERIHGTPIADLAELNARGVNLTKCAQKCLSLFLSQAFKDNFFHADMHPGNIFVAYATPDNPQIILVDFGIVGSLNKEDKRYLKENFLALFKKDYQRVTDLHLESGWIPADTRHDHFTNSMRAVCEPIFESDPENVSFAQLLLRLFQVAHRFKLNIQPQLVLFQKTLMNVEGIARHLDPTLDIWATAKPSLEALAKEECSPGVLVKQWLRKLVTLGE